MLRNLALHGATLCRGSINSTTKQIAPRCLSTKSESKRDTRVGEGVAQDEMPFHHFLPRQRSKPKFESPRKRANKMFAAINNEAVNKSMQSNPKVHDVPFRVGDSIEITMVSQGGINSTEIEKIRGVVLGRVNRGLGSGVYIRDVVFGDTGDSNHLHVDADPISLD